MRRCGEILNSSRSYLRLRHANNDGHQDFLPGRRSLDQRSSEHLENEFRDFRADILLGSKQAKEFCVVEFEDGKQDTIFKKQKKRKNPEWSARFEHAFSQITDWFRQLPRRLQE